jgi:hypothetical protein
MGNCPREDVLCAYCRVTPPFTITNTGMQITHEKYTPGDDTIKAKISRRAWELEMLDHLKAKHRAQFNQLIEDLRTGQATQVRVGIIVQYPDEVVVQYQVES